MIIKYQGQWKGQDNPGRHSTKEANICIDQIQTHECQIEDKYNTDILIAIWWSTNVHTQLFQNPFQQVLDSHQPFNHLLSKIMHI